MLRQVRCFEQIHAIPDPWVFLLGCDPKNLVAMENDLVPGISDLMLLGCVWRVFYPRSPWLLGIAFSRLAGSKCSG